MPFESIEDGITSLGKHSELGNMGEEDIKAGAEDKKDVVAHAKEERCTG